MESKIKSILENFFEGNTSLEEEQILNEFFSKGDLPKGLKAYQPLFQYFKSEKAVELPNSDFRRNVVDGIMRDLVEQYFEGETSIEDENILKTYFAEKAIATDLEQYAPIFRLAEAETHTRISSEFDSKLQTAIIGDLLEKYFEGNTALEDEQSLKTYFAQAEIADEFKQYQTFFGYTASASQKVSANFDSNLETGIIQSILDKYFEGESTLEDEAELQRYFAKAEIHESLKQYQPLFEYIESEKQITVSDNFTDGVLENIKPVERKPIVRRMYQNYMRAAAMIALVVGVLWMVDFGAPEPSPPTASIDWSKYEPKDPEEAYEKTMAALALVSNRMKEGEEQTLKGFKKIKSANDAAGIK